MSLSTDQIAPTSCNMGVTGLCDFRARVLAILIYSGLICVRKDERSLFGVFPFSYQPISMND